MSLLLFGEVHREHWKTEPGTVIGLLNPNPMKQKDGYEGVSGHSVHTVDRFPVVYILYSQKVSTLSSAPVRTTGRLTGPTPVTPKTMPNQQLTLKMLQPFNINYNQDVFMNINIKFLKFEQTQITT